MTKRLLELIKGNLSDVFSTNKTWHSKSGWRELLVRRVEDFPAANVLDVIREEVDAFWQGNKAAIRRGEMRGVLRKVCEKRTKEEDKSERLLTASVDSLCNRFNFISGLTNDDSKSRHMTIDLVEHKDLSEISAFIELKAHANQENPLCAMCQVVMYLVLYWKAKELDPELSKLSRRFQLIVMAPREYFEHYGSQSENHMMFATIAGALAAELKNQFKRRIRVAFKEINISKAAFNAADKQLEQIAEKYRAGQTVAR